MFKTFYGLAFKHYFINSETLELYRNKYISNSERGISILGIEKLKNRLLPSGSIMVTCIATMGKVLINKLPAITNQQINSIIIDNKKFSADFIY